VSHVLEGDHPELAEKLRQLGAATANIAHPTQEIR
jgi:hypothetical protein